MTRRGVIEQVLVGAGCAPTHESLAKFRVGPHSLRGLRLIRTQLNDEPLSQEDLTHLALLRLDLIGLLGVDESGEPTVVHLAHLLPPNQRERGLPDPAIRPVSITLTFNSIRSSTHSTATCCHRILVMPSATARSRPSS